MQTKNLTKTTFIQEPTKLKIVFSQTLESKVRTACIVFPHTEWSGTAFYRYTQPEDHSDMKDLTIEMVDFCLQDIGSAGYTEYTLGEEGASYFADHIDTLLGCKVALLHSHNAMAK